MTIAAMLANETLTPSETSHILRASLSSVRRGIANGRIPSFAINRRRRIPSAWVRALLARTVPA